MNRKAFRLIAITEIAFIALIALSISIAVNLTFLPGIVARTEKRTYQKIKLSESATKTQMTKLSKSAKLDLIDTLFESPVGLALNSFKPDLYEKLQENPDRLEGYLDLYESLSARPEIKHLISNLIQKKEPQQQTYSDLEGMR